MRTKLSDLAGTWYPADPAELAADIDRWTAESPEPAPAAGVVVPHAGYRYSGAVAGTAYGCLRGSARHRAVVLAPSHRMAFRGAVVPEFDAFRTPLGTVAVDPATRGLAGAGPVRPDSRPFEGEHSLEIQLPFLQRVFSKLSVVPLLCGAMAPEDYSALAELLAPLADSHTAFVVSSDFTHYGARFGYEPFPARNAAAVRERLHALDMGAIDPLLRGDARGFQAYLKRTGATVCGRVPITAFLTWAGPRYRGRLLAYRTSLDATGDFHHVVAYAAIAFRPARADH